MMLLPRKTAFTDLTHSFLFFFKVYVYIYIHYSISTEYDDLEKNATDYMRVKVIKCKGKVYSAAGQQRAEISRELRGRTVLYSVWRYIARVVYGWIDVRPP